MYVYVKSEPGLWVAWLNGSKQKLSNLETLIENGYAKNP